MQGDIPTLSGAVALEPFAGKDNNPNYGTKQKECGSYRKRKEPTD
jgi:hypothetical protein